MASGDRPRTPQRLGGCLPLPHGDCPVSSSVSSSGGLDGILGSPGCLPPVSGPSIFSSVSEVPRGGVGLPVPRSLFWPVDGSASVYMCHGSGFLGFRILCYLDDWLVLGSSFREIVRARDFLLWLCQELGIQVNLPKSSLTPTQSIDYLGMRIQTSPLRVFPDPQTGSEAVLLDSGLPLRLPPSTVNVASASRGDVFGSVSCSESQASHAVPSAAAECVRGSPGQRRSSLLGQLLPAGSLVVVRRLPSSGRSSPRCSSTVSLPVYRRFGHRLGCFPRRQPPLRLVVSDMLRLFDQPPRAPFGALRGLGFSSPSAGSICGALR